MRTVSGIAAQVEWNSKPYVYYFYGHRHISETNVAVRQQKGLHKKPPRLIIAHFTDVILLKVRFRRMSHRRFRVPTKDLALPFRN